MSFGNCGLSRQANLVLRSSASPLCDIFCINSVILTRDIQYSFFQNGSFIFVFNTTSIYIKGYYSHARLLVAEDWYKTEPVRAPLGAQPGDYVSIQGYEELFKRTPISYEHFTDVRRLIEREIEVKNNTLLWKGNPVVSYGNVITTKSVDNGYLIRK